MWEKPESAQSEHNACAVCGGLLSARPIFHDEVGETPDRNPPDYYQKRKKKFHGGVLYLLVRGISMPLRLSRPGYLGGLPQHPLERQGSLCVNRPMTPSEDCGKEERILWV